MIDLREKLNGREGFCTAVEAMIMGLKNQNDRADFTVNMMVFGDVDKQKSMCFGCAATCAVQELFGTNFNTYNITDRDRRAYAVHIDAMTLLSFEGVIDDLRFGYAHVLAEYCDLEDYDHQTVARCFECMPALTHENWEGTLCQYETALDEIKRDWGLSTHGS